MIERQQESPWGKKTTGKKNQNQFAFCFHVIIPYGTENKLEAPGVYGEVQRELMNIKFSLKSNKYEKLAFSVS